MGKLIQECWHDGPSVRLTILRVKKTLNNLLEESKDGKEYVWSLTQTDEDIVVLYLHYITDLSYR